MWRSFSYPWALVIVPTICAAHSINIPARSSGPPPNTLPLKWGPTNRLHGTGTIGSKSPQDFRFLFDTGSGDIILPYVDGSANDANSYNFAGTSLHKTHTEGFAGQTDSGPVYADDVTFAGLTGNNVQFFTTNETHEAPANDANAIIGMDYTTESNSGFASYFETLINEGKVSQPEFAFYHGTETPEFTMGGRDTLRYTGDVVTVPVVKQGYWSIDVDSVEVGGVDLGHWTGGGAIVDTGTGFIQAPSELAAAVHSAIPAAKALPPSSSSTTTRYIYPCDTPADKIPAFVIAGHTLALHPDDFNQGPVSKVSEGETPTTPMCKSVIYGNSGVHSWNLGVPFMKSWYTIFHWGAPTTGKEVGAGTAVMFALAVREGSGN